MESNSRKKTWVAFSVGEPVLIISAVLGCALTMAVLGIVGHSYLTDPAGFRVNRAAVLTIISVYAGWAFHCGVLLWAAYRGMPEQPAKVPRYVRHKPLRAARRALTLGMARSVRGDAALR